MKYRKHVHTHALILNSYLNIILHRIEVIKKIIIENT